MKKEKFLMIFEEIESIRRELRLAVMKLHTELSELKADTPAPLPIRKKHDAINDVPSQEWLGRMIQVGNNVTDIMKLPCVQSAHKRSGKDQEVAYYVLEPSAMADSEYMQYVHPGEWLMTDGKGKWHIMTSSRASTH